MEPPARLADGNQAADPASGTVIPLLDRKEEAIVKPKRLGHVVIRVRDLARSQQFYTDVLGLRVTSRLDDRMVFLSAAGDSSHELALTPVGEDAPGPDADRVGLYHFAWEMGSFDDLRRIYRKLGEKNVAIAGLGDHGISMGVYFLDPDGNEIEVFYELPRDQWPETDIFLGSFPMSLEEKPAPEAV